MCADLRTHTPPPLPPHMSWFCIGVSGKICRRYQVERIAKVAYDVAMKRGKRLCSVDKANVLDVSQVCTCTVCDWRVASLFPAFVLTLEQRLKERGGPAAFVLVALRCGFSAVLRVWEAPLSRRTELVHPVVTLMMALPLVF